MKRFLASVLCIVMVLSTMGISAIAAPEAGAAAFLAYDEVSVANLPDAFTQGTNPNGRQVLMAKDWTGDIDINYPGLYTSFYLNGYTLDGQLKLSEVSTLNLYGVEPGNDWAGTDSKIIASGTGEDYAISQTSVANLNINGTILIEATETDGIAIYANNGKVVMSSQGITVKGKIKAEDSAIVKISDGTYMGGFEAESATNLEITGGKFKVDPTAYIPAGYSAVLGADDMYSIEKPAATLDMLDTDGGKYIISTPEDVVILREVMSKESIPAEAQFVLANDIDMTGVILAPAGNDSIRFYGTFDGNNHKISNVTIEGGDSSYVAFFGNTSGATIKNLTMENITVTGGEYTAGIVGRARNTTVTNCAVTGTVEIEGHDGVGGIVGGGVANVTDCSVTGDENSYIKGLWDVGGISGLVSAGTTVIDNNVVEGLDITAEEGIVGGIVGRLLVGGTGVEVTHNTVNDTVITATGDDADYSALIVGNTTSGAVLYGGNTANNTSLTANGVDKDDLYETSENDSVVYAAASVIDGEGNFSYHATIQEAINAADTGDTVKIAAGNYVGGISLGKDITLEGSVDENGIPTTVFNSGSPAIYISKGTVKNIKIENVSKGFYGEPCGNVVFENVHMINLLYGFHLVAYSSDVTWTIKNCYTDVTWANSFGKYNCDGATIILKNNEFVSSNPYYGEEYGANLVNTFCPNTVIEDNIFGENAKILIREDAKDDATIGTNYYEDGFENALSEDCAHGVVVETYYTDKEMTETVLAPTGVLQTGAVNALDANRTFITVELRKVYATKSIKLEILDENDTLLATTTATQKVFDEFTFPMGALGTFTGINCTDDYWTTTWEENKLRGDYVPKKTVLYVDGVKLSEGTISDQLTGEITPLDWGTIPGVAPAPTGTITYGFTNQTSIWGEGTATANYSYIVELYAGEEKIAQAKLKDYNNVYDGDVYVTWSIPFDGSDSNYWDVEWYGKNPYVDTVPTKVVLVADDRAVAENIVKLCAPDDLNPVVWDELENVPAAAKLGSKRFGTIQAAIDAATAGDNEIIILPGTYDESFMINQAEGVNITLKAEQKGKVTLTGTISVNGNRRQSGAETLNIENIVFDGTTKTASHNFIMDSNGTPNYPTYAHNVTVKNCDFNGNNDYNNAVVAFREPKGGSNNIVFDGCNAKDMHSLIQVSSSLKITVTNCTLKNMSEGGVNGTGSKDIIFTNNVVDVKEYAVRTGQSSASTNTLSNVTMTDNEISAGVTALALRNATTTAVMTNNNIVAPSAYTNNNADNSTINGIPIVSENIVDEIKKDNIVTKPITPSYTGGGVVTYNWTVKFETNGGSEVKAIAVEKNDVAIEPTAPTKDGFLFDGWYTDKELTTAYDFSAKVTKNITLYAKWTEVEKEPETSALFKDVKETDWFYEYVMYVAENGLMNGVSEDEFAPNNTLTRAMLVTVLYRNAGQPATDKSIPFSDVDMSAYYADAVLWAKQNGIVNGITEIEFAPNSNITREQIATIIYRYAQYKGMETVTMEENLHFADADEISEYAVSAMNWAVGTGLLKGKTTTTLNPKDNATRAEIAAILQRFIESNK